MATLPAPRTWADADVVTAVALNADIRDSLNFLLNPPRVSVWSDTGVSVRREGESLQGGHALLTWNQVKFDSDAMWGANSSRLTVKTAGFYEVILHVEWQTLSDSEPGNRYAAITKNGSGSASMGTSAEIATDMIYIKVSSSVGEAQINHVSCHHWFDVNDYVEGVVRNTTTNALLTIPSGQPASLTFFAMRWIGASP